MANYLEGAIVKLNQPAAGIFSATQISDAEAVSSALQVAPKPDVRINFGPLSFFGIVTVSGYVDTSTYEASISVSVIGINIGTLSGNLHDGITLKVNLIAVKGELRFYLKNGNELWLHVDLKVVFDGSYNDDVKIISL
ncbi:hypothetical protein KXW98_002700 [Aspergillus fumigatus]|uniref:Uncharacterized protein n=1 Tax=Aspergillus fumigatus TaxID=746128 RepID=A0A229YBC8_ASPFM|nr:hypothetical protein CNMCM8714_008514 [Aspergillus fumigatus]KAF4276300.1 hypothetical protein CNMCM8812_002257 [Aspergillus fumigatus]KAF4278357.1 hypothetical protein CNMCM8057_000791 [Aspergillus fumigatus]KAF4281570.1 hypothetical protein CNMCM8689_000502 [Aspergillus fumigatus]KAF4294606.1 hypothetical protein CNMCM8686_002664 [Aspergillus fumigatus]